MLIVNPWHVTSAPIRYEPCFRASTRYAPAEGSTAGGLFHLSIALAGSSERWISVVLMALAALAACPLLFSSFATRRIAADFPDTFSSL